MPSSWGSAPPRMRGIYQKMDSPRMREDPGSPRIRGGAESVLTPGCGKGEGDPPHPGGGIINLERSVNNMYACPLCGKDSNRKGNPFSSVQTVVGHIDGCHDDDHANVRGEELREEIEATASAPPDDEDEPEPETDDTEPPAPVEEPDENPGADPGEGPGEDPAQPPKKVEMTPDEVDEMMSAVEEEAYERGQEDAQTDAGEDEPIEVESTVVEESPAETTEPSFEKCPECGNMLLDGDDVVSELEQEMQEDEDIAEFVAANEGVEPDLACQKVRACGYYVEDGEAKKFNQPGGSSSGGLAVLILVGLAGLLARALGKGNTNQQQNEIEVL